MKALFVFLVWLILFDSSAALARSDRNARDCASGAHVARVGKYDRALLEWRLLATDSSQKSWTRAISDCLQRTGIAGNDKAVAVWLTRAVTARSRHAIVPLALLYAAGDGVSMDLYRARELLGDAARNGDEAADFLILKLDELK